ncbi:MAG: serine hydrolase domain-containing protein [Phycisphaerae bacterium]
MLWSSLYLMASLPAAPAVSQADIDARFEESARGARIRAYVEAQQKEQAIPGLSLAIAIDHSVVWSRAFGLSDLENAVPATPQTVYRIASISRLVTAICVMQLVQQGKIALNTSVRDFVPELPNKGHRITVEHILAHLSGIRPIKSSEELFNSKRYARLVDALDPFKDDPLIAPPGQRFLYTPLAYTLLGLIVERVSGLGFRDYLKQHVFGPASMDAADVDDPTRIIPRRARGYVRRKDGSVSNARFVDSSLLLPAEGIVATAEDLAKLAIAWQSGRLVDAPLRDLMMTEYKTAGGYGTHYGLGCFVRTWAGRKIVGHGGWQPQVSSFLLILPEDRIAVAILANLEQADVKTMSLHIAKILLGIDDPSLKRAREVSHED